MAKPKHTGKMPPALAKYHQSHGVPKSLPKGKKAKKGKAKPNGKAPKRGGAY